jgi:GTP-binding protein HflX
VEQSDLLIHLVDASSPQLDSQMASVYRILGDLALDDIPRILAFNKMDLADAEELGNRCRVFNGIPIAATDRRSLGELVNQIGVRLELEDASRAADSQWN